MKKTVLLIISLLSPLAFPGDASSQEKNLFRKSRVIMGTSVEIVVSRTRAVKAEEAMEAAFREVQRIDFLMSNYREDSEICRVNRNAGKKETKVSPEILRVIQQALDISSLSAGAFDITIGPVLRLWNFREGKFPEEKDLRENLKKVDYRQIKIDRIRSSIFFQKQGMEIDLGAIAKGYAVDRASDILQKKGIDNFLVNAGGDLKVNGSKEKGLPWTVGIRHPRLSSTMIAKLSPRQAGVATSGDYERFFMKEGERYHHLLNPSTGTPARECQSVTVMAPSAMAADALATAIFVLGPPKGLALLKRMNDVHAIIVDRGGSVLVSPHWPKGILLPP
jgi:thiamine biosynthesis lipoprotein